jgi:putative nucleotidyltransferase with HDIG domain
MEDIQFISYPLKKIYPDLELPGDLYIFIGGKFIKYKNSGDPLPAEKYEQFLLKRVQFLFINQADLAKYNSWYSGIFNTEQKEVIQRIGEENKEIAVESAKIKDEVLSFITADVTEESVKKVIEETREFINKIKANKNADKFMIKLMSYSQSVSDHSTNVANLSMFLALNCGYNQQVMLENIYLGALLHDYGKLKISANLLEDPNSPAYDSALKKHPHLGKTALLLDSGFPDEVLRIIAEHHERHDGKGYPKGIKGPRIYELTKIVSIANEFDNIVMKEQGPISQRQRRALKFITEDQGKIFDPKLLAKCIRAIEPVI